MRPHESEPGALSALKDRSGGDAMRPPRSPWIDRRRVAPSVRPRCTRSSRGGGMSTSFRTRPGGVASRRSDGDRDPRASGPPSAPSASMRRGPLGADGACELPAGRIDLIRLMNLLRTSLLACLAAGATDSSQAPSDVAVFGVLDASVARIRTDAGAVTGLASGGVSGSRLGLRGAQDLEGGPSGGIWLEAGVDPDNGNADGVRFDRRSTVSLSDRRWGGAATRSRPTRTSRPSIRSTTSASAASVAPT